jgi:hypothetical protein
MWATAVMRMLTDVEWVSGNIGQLRQTYICYVALLFLIWKFPLGLPSQDSCNPELCYCYLQAYYLMLSISVCPYSSRRSLRISHRKLNPCKLALLYKPIFFQLMVTQHSSTVVTKPYLEPVQSTP